MLSTALTPLAYAETHFSADIGVATVYADNIELAAPDGKSSGSVVVDINPVLRMTQDSARFKSALSYQAHSFSFLEDSDFNTTYHQGDGSASWTALPDWLTLNAIAGYDQRIVDPTRATSSDRLFSTGNLSDTASASISPRILHRFGGIQLAASYTYGVVDYKNDPADFGGSIDITALDDSKDQSAQFSLGSAPNDEWQRFGWEVGYNWEHTSYDVSLPYEYARASLLTSIGLSSGFSLLAEGGRESDLVTSTVDGGLSETYWRGGFRYAPDSRTSLQLMYGDRFFGTTYSGRFTHRASRLEISLGYSEEPTTEGRQILRRDTAPGSIVPPPPGIDITRSTSEPFISKQLDGELRLKGRVTTIYLRIASDRQDFLRTESTDRVRAATVGMQRVLGARTVLDIGASTARTEFRDGSNGIDNDVAISLNRRVSRTFVIGGVARYLDRWGSGLDDYRAWSVGIQVRKSFGSGAVATLPATSVR